MESFLTLVIAASAALYTCAAVAHAYYVVRSHYDSLARWSTRAAWLVSSLGLGLLVAHAGRPPFYTVFEFMYFLSWLVVTNYIGIEMLRDNQAAGAFVVPAVALIQVVGVALPKPSAGHEAYLSPVLVSWHIGVSMMGYLFLLAASVAGALYLWQNRNLRQKRWGPMYYRLPSLEALDLWGGRFAYLGYPLLTIGIVTGLFFAEIEWAHFWQTDPKVIFTLLVWLVYGGYLLMRKVWGWGGRRSAWWSVIGVAGLLINYFVMNVLSRTHRFGL